MYFNLHVTTIVPDIINTLLVTSHTSQIGNSKGGGGGGVGILKCPPKIIVEMFEAKLEFKGRA